MINSDLIAIKDSILKTVGEDCEKIYLFGSYAYGTPREDSDYDIFVVLNDGAKKPMLVLEDIHSGLAGKKSKSVDVLANYKSRFEQRSKLPTMERTVASRGKVLYERP